MAQASRLAKDLTLRGSATTIPKLVYGTAWKAERSADLVYMALKNGFRGIDTAAQPKHYNEGGVGQGLQRAVRDGIVKREDVFVQTKFSPPSAQSHDTPYDLGAPLPDKVHQSVESSLRYFTIEGQEPYLDSVVLHSPLPTIEETLTAWKTLEGYVPHKIRNLGISNTTLSILRSVDEHATIKPSVVQNRFHAQTDFEVSLRAFCREKDIVFQSFWTLSANKPLYQSHPVKEVAEKAGVPTAVAYYSLVLGLEGLAILDGTTNEQHMRDDLEGLHTIGTWAEAEGNEAWKSALVKFKELIQEV